MSKLLQILSYPKRYVFSESFNLALHKLAFILESISKNLNLIGVSPLSHSYFFLLYTSSSSFSILGIFLLFYSELVIYKFLIYLPINLYLFMKIPKIPKPLKKKVNKPPILARTSKMFWDYLLCSIILSPKKKNDW
jgi:hypothetical protein